MSFTDALRQGKAQKANIPAQNTDAFQPVNLYTGALTDTEKTGAAKTAADMTMEEYKSYIHDQISRIPRHPSRLMDTVSINISEAGFEAMKNDPEYEKWVLDGLAQNFAVNNPWTSMAGGCYHVINIGATKEDYRGQSWYAGFNNGKGKDSYDEKSKNSFWEKRADRHKESMEKSAELAYMRHITERIEGNMANWGLGGQRL
jgi:predicted MarR family transcription regulator